MTDETIFATALEKAGPAERAAFLAEACGDDTERRQRLEGLLMAHARAAHFLERPPVAAPDPDHFATQALTGTPDPGVAVAQTTGGENGTCDDEPLTFLAPPTRPDALGRIGHYEVMQVLGRGGFGIVFRAFDEILQRVVALKVMAPQLAATSPARKRFLREARSSAQVRHENVVQVYEVAEQPLPYLAMEFIPGETLQQQLDRVGPLDVPEVLRIGRQIAEGLAAAHAMDLIHRDIKPGNVLLEGGQQKVKITDFGLARTADDASISQSGIIAGTPMYMAPEQAQGQTLDQRADLFSLGSVLYQMVTGRPPFRANGTVAVLKRVAEDTPRAIREIIPETPQWLCDIIAKLHAKDPDARYQSAREVADVLADCEAQLKANSKLKDYSRIPRGEPLPRGGGLARWVAAATILVVIGVSIAWWRDRVLKFFGSRPPSITGTTAGPQVSRKVAWGDVVDPLVDCRFVEDDGRLTIEVPGGPQQHDLNPQPGRRNLNAPRVLREVEGDFEARVTVSDWMPNSPLTSRAGRPYVGAGLIVWQDENHFLWLYQSRLDLPPDPSYSEVRWLWGAGESHSKQLTSLPRFEKKQLRIRRVNGVLSVAQSSNGLDWTDDAAMDFSFTGPVRVGVVAMSTLFQDFTAEFEGFEVKGLPPSARLPNAPPVAEPDRRAAEWVLKHNGVVKVNNQKQEILPGDDLPREPFRLTYAGLLGNAGVVNLGRENVTDNDLRIFEGCKNLLQLKLKASTMAEVNRDPIVTDKGLAHFKDCKNLQSLYLNGSWFTDAGLLHFKECKDLTILELDSVPVTDKGLAVVRGFPNLKHLSLRYTRVTGAGLVHLKDCKNLAHVHLLYTQIGDAGLAHFKDMPLKSLWITDTAITDLTPLQGMSLEDVRLTPKNITRGLDILRQMKSLKTIGVEWYQAWPAAEFWKRYDKGEFK